ncbi:hypothetical protein BDZ91DRAFT_655514 [Kalaharituber pfeilii]|nr:hypothetical protein BDZ91DRAFT_655514 [Kalaharituber pfeilii]
MSTSPHRPAITAHVLDTTFGRPASNIPVSLFLLPSRCPFSLLSQQPTLLATSITNSDGRIVSWTFSAANLEISTTKGTTYLLRFETKEYYEQVYGPAGGFFPWIDVVFVMGAGEDGGDGRVEDERKHYHVPVLLSRFSYTTYRGS